MPFGVKADCEVAGYVNTMGMKVDKKFDYFNQPAKESIWPVRKLEEVGAVMIGKMNQRKCLPLPSARGLSAARL